MKPTYKGWQYWIKLTFTTTLSLIFALSITIVLFSYQQAMVYVHPARRIASGDLLRANGIEFQEVELITEDEVKLSAWYTPPKNGAVILAAHGHADMRSEDFYLLFASQGYGVLAWDFRAHGNSEGDFSSVGYYEVLDAKAALEYLLAQLGVEHIGAWGGSMGAVTMIRAAAQYPEIEAVVADSPFAALEDELNLRAPYPTIRQLIGFFAERETGGSLDWVRPVDDIARISPRPVFIIQGMGDTMISPDSGHRLYNAAGEPRLLWMEPDAPHMNMYSYYRTRYAKRVIKFFDEYLLGK